MGIRLGGQAVPPPTQGGVTDSPTTISLSTILATGMTLTMVSVAPLDDCPNIAVSIFLESEDRTRRIDLGSGICSGKPSGILDDHGNDIIFTKPFIWNGKLILDKGLPFVLKAIIRNFTGDTIRFTMGYGVE